jgi:hypothetical protein
VPALVAPVPDVAGEPEPELPPLVETAPSPEAEVLAVEWLSAPPVVPLDGPPLLPPLPLLSVKTQLPTRQLNPLQQSAVVAQLWPSEAQPPEQVAPATQAPSQQVQPALQGHGRPFSGTVDTQETAKMAPSMATGRPGNIATSLSA